VIRNGQGHDWQPVAARAMLEKRASMLQQIREFMLARSILEVETPVLDRYANTDPNIESLKTRLQLTGADGIQEFYLHTSPEFAMKRLLAAGSGPVYQITKVFRDAESGRLHHPEFTMLEWYRPGFDHHALMAEIEELLQSFQLQGCERQSYGQVFEQYSGLNPHVANDKDLQDQARALGFDPANNSRSILLDLLFSHKVIPNLARNTPVFIYEYPACQAALARLNESTPAVAERFELFINGIEIANGYNELTDNSEQYSRFCQDNKNRVDCGKNELPMDENLLAAIKHGLPACAGVALGLDRLLMVLTGSKHIGDVLAFPLPGR